MTQKERTKRGGQDRQRRHGGDKDLDLDQERERDDGQGHDREKTETDTRIMTGTETETETGGMIGIGGGDRGREKGHVGSPGHALGTGAGGDPGKTTEEEGADDK